MFYDVFREIYDRRLVTMTFANPSAKSYSDMNTSASCRRRHSSISWFTAVFVWVFFF